MNSIPGYEGYFVTKEGEVYSSKRKGLRKLKQGTCKDGYKFVGLFTGKKVSHQRVHRLVMLAFRGHSRLQVNHKDFNKQNNHIENLEYVTQSENMKWNVLNKHSHVGEMNAKAKLDWAKVLTIYTLSNFKTNSSLADHYGVAELSVEKVRQGKNWSCLYYACPKVVRKDINSLKKMGWINPKRKYTDKEKKQVLEMVAQGVRQAEIAKKFGTSLSCLEVALRRYRGVA